MALYVYRNVCLRFYDDTVNFIKNFLLKLKYEFLSEHNNQISKINNNRYNAIQSNYTGNCYILHCFIVPVILQIDGINKIVTYL